MKIIVIIVLAIAAVSFSCNDRSAGQTKAVAQPSAGADSAAISDSNSKEVNLADSATNMINKAEDKMEEAADKTKDAINK
jgi:hypothetical protein